MSENTSNLNERSEAHVFKHVRETLVQRWCVRWRQFISLFPAIGISQAEKLYQTL